jgi:hypothetical protein
LKEVVGTSLKQQQAHPIFRLDVHFDPPTWRIAFDGEHASFPYRRDEQGFRVLRRIIDCGAQVEFVWTTADGRAVQKEVRVFRCSEGPLEKVHATPRHATPRHKLEAAIADVQARALKALKAGDKRRYDELTLQVIGGRECLRKDSGFFDKRMPNDNSRAVEATRKAIQRAITEIAKRCPKLGGHLKQFIVRIDSDGWFYSGEREWDCSDTCGDEIKSATGGLDPGGLDPDAIRADWLRNHRQELSGLLEDAKSLGRFGPWPNRCAAEKSCTYPPLVDGVCGYHRRMNRMTRDQVLERLRTSGSKSFSITSPAYKGKTSILEVLGGRKKETEDGPGSAEESEAAEETRCGDDSETGDFDEFKR